MNETDIETRVSAEVVEAEQLFESGRMFEAAKRLGWLQAEARSADDSERDAAIAAKLSDIRARVRLTDVPSFDRSYNLAFDRARNGLAQGAGLSGLGALGVFGFVLVWLVPISEFFAWLGAGGVNTVSGLLVGLGFIAGVPLGLGLALLAPALSRSPGDRVLIGLVLVGWVAPLGAGLATNGDYSQRDMYLTIAEVGVLPGLLGLAFIGWAVRDIVRAHQRVARGHLKSSRH